MEQRHTFLIRFDVAEPLRRNRLERALDGYGHQVIPGAFQASLDGDRFDRLVSEVLPLIDADRDTLHIYRLCV